MLFLALDNLSSVQSVNVSDPPLVVDDVLLHEEWKKLAVDVHLREDCCRVTWEFQRSHDEWDVNTWLGWNVSDVIEMQYFFHNVFLSMCCLVNCIPVVVYDKGDNAKNVISAKK